MPMTPPSLLSSLSSPSTRDRDAHGRETTAVIDGGLSCSPSSSGGTASDVLGGSSEENESTDEDLLLAHSEELLSFLDNLVPIDQVSSVQTSSGVSVGAAGSGDGEVLVAKTTSRGKTTHGKKSSSTMTPSVNDATRKRNKYRDQMKRELQSLRKCVAELEAELAALRQGAVTLSLAHKASIALAWKRMAKNQLEWRKQSEAENALLKKEVLAYIQMMQSIDQTLGKRPHGTVLRGNTISKGKRGRVCTELLDPDGYAELVKDVDASYARLDAVFRESGIDQVTSELPRSARIKTKVTESGVPMGYMELTDASVEPFDSRTTACATWRTILRLYIPHNDAGTERIWQTDDAFAVKYHPPNSLGNGDRVLLPSKLVMRKFAERDDRTVIVWRAHSQCEGDLFGTFADETGWTVIQSISDSSGTSSSGSIIRSCLHFTQRPSAATSLASSEAPTQPCVDAAFKAMVHTASDIDLAGVTKMMQNLLLDGVTSTASNPKKSALAKPKV